jgi:hypothetical protein
MIVKPIPYEADAVAYKEAIEALLDVCRRHPDTSGARAAAQVLLSCYNGYEFNLDPTEIIYLSSPYQEAAYTVLIQRVLCQIEPQKMVANGEVRFETLVEYYEHLHVRKRHL